MPEHRIEKSSSHEEDILDLEPEAPVEPHPALSRPQRDPALAAQAKKPLPCPKCGYDLRGLRGRVCPECGATLNPSKLAASRDPRSGVEQSEWFDRSAVTWGVIGLVMGLSVYAISAGATVGPLVFAIDFVATVAIGWAVFLFCSLVWIGFDQPLRMTMVQLTGAYGFYAGVYALAETIPYLGWVVQLFAFVCLLGLLAKLLDIEWKDALVIAIGSSIIKWMMVLWLISQLVAASGSGPAGAPGGTP